MESNDEQGWIEESKWQLDTGVARYSSEIGLLIVYCVKEGGRVWVMLLGGSGLLD